MVRSIVRCGLQVCSCKVQRLCSRLCCFCWNRNRRRSRLNCVNSIFQNWDWPWTSHIVINKNKTTQLFVSVSLSSSIRERACLQVFCTKKVSGFTEISSVITILCTGFSACTTWQYEACTIEGRFLRTVPSFLRPAFLNWVRDPLTIHAHSPFLAGIFYSWFVSSRRPDIAQ